MKIRLFFFFLIGLRLTGLNAQESINTTGGDAYGREGSVSYSVGQVAYQTIDGTSGLVAQGVQQSFEISVVTDIEKAKSINLLVLAYPNPTTDYLTLSINELEISNFSFQLYNIQGNLLQSEKITSKQTSIDMSNLVPAVYFLKVIKANEEVITFKIIKTQ